jgi:hypothetical protein
VAVLTNSSYEEDTLILFRASVACGRRKRDRIKERNDAIF